MSSNRLKLLTCLGLLTVCTIVLSGCWSPWSDTTRYNGAQTLESKTYKNLEINGAATLTNVTIDNNLSVSGSVEVSDVVVKGMATIRGALEVRKHSCLNSLDIAGSLTANGLTVNNILTLSGSIDAAHSNFKAITIKRSKNNKKSVYYFRNSKIGTMNIAGFGRRRVILNNSTADNIEFEDEGGIVQLQGNATVGKVINGEVTKK
jgi:hypothetical protein